MDKLKSIHLGAGGRGLRHVIGYMASPYWDVVAVVDRLPERLEVARQQTGIGKELCFADLFDSLAATDADAIVAVGEASLHTGMIGLALDAGKHVVTEKPFTIDLAEAEKIVETAESKNLCVMVAHNHRYVQTFRTMRRLLDEGRYGRVGYAMLMHTKSRGSPYRTMPHMHLWDQGSHNIDTLVSVLPSPVKRVYGKSFHPTWSDWPSPSTIVATIEFENGVVAQVLSTSDSRVPKLYPKGASDFYFRVDCEKGSLATLGYWHPPGGRLIATEGWQRGVEYPGDPEGDELPLDTPAAASPHWYEAEMAHDFYNYIVDGKEPEISGRNNLKVMRVLDAIIRCTESNQAVEF